MFLKLTNCVAQNIKEIVLNNHKKIIKCIKGNHLRFTNQIFLPFDRQ